VSSSKQLADGLFVGLFLMPLFAVGATLKVGDRAPDFALPDQEGKIMKLSDFQGKSAVVLAFYIRASTPG
jgi:cytochrome oxidase Cu insertion factor (SCO1/SenC/PrrC family)